MRNLPGLTALVWMLAAGGVGAEEWKTVATGEVVIRVRERADVPGGREVWAEGELAANIRDVQTALRDHESFRFWMPYVTESKLLATEPDGRLTYTRLDFPVISNRDYVLRVVDEQLLAEDGTGLFRQRWVAQGKALPERDGVVRLHRNEGSWHFAPKGEGRVAFTYRFTVEPGGSIPGFLAGLGEKGAVMDTVRAVEKRAQKLGSARASAH
ncbi:MAG TPA: SRPBCC family protein [Archangium sp.]|jgi:hypothetical protein|uniref:SRPBCC family protein n=1 Tax=Archangium sp. TaxID=1872627 RepID=UPI002ED9BDAA